MTLESAVMDFGYPAIFLGTFLEGETILIIGGFAADRGYLSLQYVILAAFLGSLFGDQLYFLLGRYKGLSILVKFKNWEKRTARFQALMDRYGTFIILIFRFMYGLRTVAPFAIGLSNVTMRKFVILNIISAAVWATALGVLGYIFGRAFETVLRHMKWMELVLIALLLCISAAVFVIKRIRNRKK
jgi:membrane protein DedA with SNARE-associated domain